MPEHPLLTLSLRYPQLLLHVRSGMKDTEEYKDAVLRGKKIEGRPDFSMNENDSLTSFVTPAGEVDVLFLFDRADFEHAVRSLANRCEPVSVPASMGASSISGLINWEKLRPHMDDEEEFKRFTSDKKNYLDSLIILSSGEYSAVPADRMMFGREEWLEKSVTIRKYHELAHFYSRRRYPENKEAIRDEIVADMIGIIAAFGRYDTSAARIFLGIEGDSYREGGRLQNYVEDGDGAAMMARAEWIIDALAASVCQKDDRGVFGILDFVEENKIGIQAEE